MAYYFLTASKDASIYLQQPNQNTGLDEILEISKVYYGNIKDVSRALLKFEVGFLSSSLVNNTIKLDISAYNTGIYFVSAVVEGKTYSQKLIVK
jgi:hypothetical protein